MAVPLLRRFMSRPGKVEKDDAHRAFARIAADALAAGGVERDAIAYDTTKFTLRYGKATLALESGYSSFKRYEDKLEGEGFVKRWIRSLQESRGYFPTSFAQARARLLPALRPIEEAWYPSLRASTAAAYVDRAFPAPGLVASVAFDRESSVARVPANLLRSWNVDAESVWNAAMDNLRARSTGAWDRVTPTILYSAWRDGYDASRVLLPDVLERAGAGRSPYVMIPSRDRLIVSDCPDDAALERFVRSGLALYDEDPMRRSPQLLRLMNGRLGLAPVPRALAVEVGKRTIASIGSIYGAQREANATAFPGAHFASFVQMSGASDSYVCSMAVWSENHELLLPKAGIIAFYVTERDVVRVRWNDAVAVLGPFEEVADFKPVRYRTHGFPSKKQLTKLRAFAIDFEASPEAVYA